MKLIAILVFLSFYTSIPLQAACCLTSSALSIRPYAPEPHLPYIDDTTGLAHAFDLDFEMKWRSDLAGGQCELEWWEEADYIVPGLRGIGIEANRWYDHKIYNALSPMWRDWDRKQSRLSSQEPYLQARISDFPGLGLSGVDLFISDSGELIMLRTSKTRHLRIKAIVKSGSVDCAIDRATFSLSQYLEVREGEPFGGYLEVHKTPHLIIND